MEERDGEIDCFMRKLRGWNMIGRIGLKEIGKLNIGSINMGV